MGQTLTADTSGIDDDDELTNVAFSYQWLADDADIAGAAGSTYTLVDADEGRTIKVVVSFTDDAGNEESLTSAAIGPVEPRPERAISEVPPEAVPELPPGGVFAGFTLVNLDDKSEVHVLADGATVKLDDPAGGSYAILADTHDDVRNLATIAIGSVELVLIGAKEVTTVDRYVAYSLYGGGVPEPLKGGNLPVGSYRLTATAYEGLNKAGAELGTLVVSFEVQERQALSANSPATGQPTISGTKRVGELLTAHTGGIHDDDGLDNATFSYQWDPETLFVVHDRALSDPRRHGLDVRGDSPRLRPDQRQY